MAVPGLTVEQVLFLVYSSFIIKKYTSLHVSKIPIIRPVPFVNDWDFKGKRRYMNYTSLQWFALGQRYWLLARGEEIHEANEFCTRDLIAISLTPTQYQLMRKDFLNVVSRVLEGATYFRKSLIAVLEDGRFAFHPGSVYAPALFAILDEPNFRRHENRWRDIPGSLVFPDLRFLSLGEEGREPRYKPQIVPCLVGAIMRVLEGYDANLDLKERGKRN